MTKSLSFLLAGIAFATLSNYAFAVDSAAPSLPGHYYLGGVTEVGSELLLKKDGTFEWSLSYGNSDQLASGDWHASATEVTLQTVKPGKAPAFRLFTEEEFTIKALTKQGVWAAIVGHPAIGPMPGVEVMFEAKSGKTATAITQEGGEAMVDMPESEQWTRAGLRREGTKDDYSWVVMTPKRTAARIAGFAVTDPQWLTGQAFEKMTLQVVKGGLKVSSPDNGLSRGVYAKPKAE